jgi:BolA family transcriptional regulator, general stress-responsive regulator
MNTQETIIQRLSEALNPGHLDVFNESHMHRTEPGAESHFKVLIVSQAFVGQRLISRHRQVNQLLADLLAGPVHALALHTYTEEEWQQKGAAPRSPVCASKLGPQ